MNYFDCHADTLTKIAASENLWENSGCLDLARVRRYTGRYAQIFAIFKDKAGYAGAGTEEVFMQAYERACGLLKAQSEHMSWCLTASDMHKAHEEGKAAAFLSVEDISIMGRHIGRIRELGIRFALLSWNYENEYACGAVADQSKGLTKEGRALVKELLGKQIVLDISHLSDRGAEDLFEMTDQPVMASHSNVREVFDHPRNLKKEHIKELIRRKGLIGLNFYKRFVGEQPDLTDLVRHADAVLELGGEDILALGSDFDGCGDQFPRGIAGVQSIPGIREAFEREGFGMEVTEKIFFQNAQRFVSDVL